METSTAANLRPAKHEVITGTITHGKIEGRQWAGEAFYYPEDDYFQLQLAIFPFPYYVCRNKDSSSHYTVWAQKVKDVYPVLFRRPVGVGVIENDLKNYLEIHIPLLGLPVNPLLCLFPVR